MSCRNNIKKKKNHLKKKKNGIRLHYHMQFAIYNFFFLNLLHHDSDYGIWMIMKSSQLHHSQAPQCICGKGHMRLPLTVSEYQCITRIFCMVSFYSLQSFSNLAYHRETVGAQFSSDSDQYHNHKSVTHDEVDSFMLELGVCSF